MSEIKNYGKSVRARLLNVAKHEEIFFQTILTRYFQERLLYRISQTQYKDNFYLKGGVLMYAYERFAARPTLDIDFLGNRISNDGQRIIDTFKEIYAAECLVDGVAFATDKITAKEITEFKDYHGIRLSIPVTMDTITQVMTMDIGFGDVVTPEPVNLDYPLLLEDLPEANILAYSIETVIAEKMHAIIDLADQSSRMKDYYDLYHLLTGFTFDETILQEAIVRTFQNRHTPYTADTVFFGQDFPNHPEMQIRWSAFLKKSTIKNEISFAEVTRRLQEKLAPYWEAYSKTE
ncbi:nucleotidyl transferase AbiEii/AbiGii toxin family protein [Bacteroides sp. AN502(2024)]|uniref:nucleotidyl transferase AbiEii/AbiGii toxin family protein n=1 Tax=Bacteroides sp. AN502(2024) TaxID=3160599 RepID=UPI00351691AD